MTTSARLGLVGRKVGMTRIFTSDGDAVPVTVLDVSNNRVTQIKTPDSDGYAAIQVTYGTRRASRVGKPLAGHLAKAGVEAGSILKEFRIAADQLASFQVGGKVGVELFKEGQKVDVQGTSIGKGFAGVMKRHHFAGGRASHGNSLSHRAPGSIGQRQTPGRVFPNMKMSGHMGNKRRTTQSLMLVSIDEARGLLLIKGAVPGSKGGNVIVRSAAKTKV